MVDEGSHPLGRDPIGRRQQEVIRIVRLQEAEPAPISGSDQLARALGKVSSRSGGTIKHVTGRIGRLEGLAIGLGPLVHGQMLQRSHLFTGAAS